MKCAGQVVLFTLVSTSDYETEITTGAPSVTISKNGAAYAAPTGSVSHIGNGTWKIVVSAADVNTDGPMGITGVFVGGSDLAGYGHCQICIKF